MLPGGCHPVTLRIFFHDFHIRHQCGAREDAFKKIVAQHGVFRNPASQSGFERINVIDAFSRERTFAKQILVHVGNGKDIGVNAACGGEKALKERTVVTNRQRRRNAWLQHAIALHHSAGFWVKPWPV